MIPLAWFLIAWLILLVIFVFMTLLTVAMTVRYGLSCVSTYVATGLFLLVILVVLFLTGSYLLGIDWSQNFTFFSSNPSSLFPN